VGKRSLTASAVTAAAMLAAGCGTAAPQARAHPAAPALTPLTRLQACQRLQADITRNGGTADVPALRYIADRVTTIPDLARDARDAVKDIAHTGIAPIPLALLKDDCARVGVHIPVP
jgi:hypothetical protein